MIELLRELWYDHAIKSVETIRENKVTRRCKLTTIPNNKPDITTRDEDRGTCMLTDIAM